MTIAFYKVDNSLNYERHEFDQFCDRPQEVLDMLQRLPQDEVKFYDADKDETTETQYIVALHAHLLLCTEELAELHQA